MMAPFKREQPRVLEIVSLAAIPKTVSFTDVVTDKNVITGAPNQFSQGRTTCLLLGCRVSSIAQTDSHRATNSDKRNTAH